MLGKGRLSGAFGAVRVFVEHRVRHHRFWFVLAGLIATALVACGGGGIVTTPVSTPTTIPTTVPTTGPNGQPTTAPTTIPTTVPTNTPNSTLKVAPPTVTIASIGAQTTLTATQTTPTALTTSGCTGVASASVGTIGPSTSIVVTATAAGTCTLIVADQAGQKVGVVVTVPSAAMVTPPPSVPAGTFPLLIQNSSGLAGNVTAYIIGRSVADGATYQYVPSLTATSAVTASGPVPGLTLPAAGGVIYAPPLCGARVFIAINGGTLSIPATSSGFTGPAPWSGDASANVIWDFAEYTWDPPGTAGQACPNSFGVDMTAVDAIGIPISLQLYQNSQLTAGPVALQPNAGTNVAAGLRALGAPWPSLIQSFTTAQGTSATRILNPSHAIGAPYNFPSNYLDAYMLSICQTYSTTDLIEGGTHANIPGYTSQLIYGRYTGTCGTASQKLTFYDQPNQGGNVIANATFNGVPSTSDAFMNAGYFRPAQPGDTIGRILAVGINRSTFTAQAGSTLQSFAPQVGVTQPVCPATATQSTSPFYGGTATSGGTMLNVQVTTNWYSAIAHTYAFGNNVYGFADDDECLIYAPYINGPNTAAAGTYFVLTLQPF